MVSSICRNWPLPLEFVDHSSFLINRSQSWLRSLFWPTSCEYKVGLDIIGPSIHPFLELRQREEKNHERHEGGEIAITHRSFILTGSVFFAQSFTINADLFFPTVTGIKLNLKKNCDEIFSISNLKNEIWSNSNNIIQVVVGMIWVEGRISSVF